jgi:hypothetical protein
VYLGTHRSAGQLERGLENLLVVAARVLLGVPYLRHLHRPVYFAGAMHDQPERCWYSMSTHALMASHVSQSARPLTIPRKAIFPPSTVPLHGVVRSQVSPFSGRRWLQQVPNP